MPHVIEMIQADYDELFAVLNTEPGIQVLLNPFITAYQNDSEKLNAEAKNFKPIPKVSDVTPKQVKLDMRTLIEQESSG